MGFEATDDSHHSSREAVDPFSAILDTFYDSSWLGFFLRGQEYCFLGKEQNKNELDNIKDR